jgi:hypothetical protein
MLNHPVLNDIYRNHFSAVSNRDYTACREALYCSERYARSIRYTTPVPVQYHRWAISTLQRFVERCETWFTWHDSHSWVCCTNRRN